MPNPVYLLLKLNRLLANRRLKTLAVLGAEIVRARVLSVRLDPAMTCNLSCRMCHFSDPQYRAAHKGTLKRADIDRILDMLLPRAIQFVLGCGAEPTVYAGWVGILKKARAMGVPFVTLTTNGQLLTKDAIIDMVALPVDEITLSVHGVTKQTYESFMTRASFDRLLEVLDLLESEKKLKGTPVPRIRMNYTVNNDNLAELRQFFNTFGKYSIAVLQVRPMVHLGNTAYPTEHLQVDAAQYQRTVELLASQCRERGITFLSSPLPQGSDDGKQAESPMIEYVHRYVSPERVWREDWDWRNETYKQYLKRIKWRGKLLMDAIGRHRKSEEDGRYLGYDIR